MSVFRKLQLAAQDRMCVLAAPEEFAPQLAGVEDRVDVDTSLRGSRRYGFVLLFVQSSDEIAKNAPRVAARLQDDGLLWVAYPKKSSKRYTTDISRDHGWQPLGDLGFEAVRQVAIDEDWSALRFRQVDHIPTLRRAASRAMTVKGKQRAGRWLD